MSALEKAKAYFKELFGEQMYSLYSKSEMESREAYYLVGYNQAIEDAAEAARLQSEYPERTDDTLKKVVDAINIQEYLEPVRVITVNKDSILNLKHV